MEKELKQLKDELEVRKEAKPVSKACEEITGFAGKTNEPFSTTAEEPNPWHKSEGGGCVIL